MELLYITPTKLKITLSKEDMERYGLLHTNGTPEEGVVGGVLRSILSDAKVHGGFEGPGKKLLFQLYPSKDGSGELFVSAFSPRGEGRSRPRSACRALFRFAELSDLFMAVRAFKDRRSATGAEVYLGEDGAYYFYCTEEKEALYSPVSEFAERLPLPLLEYVREHGTPLFAPDPLETLATLV